MNAIPPPRLRKGDLIGLVAPASSPRPLEKIEASVRYLEGCGYRVKVGANAEKEHGYLAGSDAERADDFNAMIRDRAVKGIFALRGGYGTPRILARLDYAGLRRTPKIISGFSDITALQMAIYRKCRLVTFSGPMPAVEFWKDPDPFTEENFWRWVTSHRKPGATENPAGEPFAPITPGTATGILLGGNLSLLTSSVGTPFMPSLREALLVLEEVDEEPYRVDRMLTQLSNAGVGRQINGLLLGRFTRCAPKNPDKPFLPTEAVLAEFARALKVPAAGNLAYGHVPRKLTIPFGVRTRLTVKNSVKIEPLHAGVE